jgi:hypothetical protein
MNDEASKLSIINDIDFVEMIMSSLLTYVHVDNNKCIIEKQIDS